jgi:hypothetical protein
MTISVARVATEETMAAERPQFAGPGDRRARRIGEERLGLTRHLTLGVERLDPQVDLGHIKADGLEVEEKLDL